MTARPGRGAKTTPSALLTLSPSTAARPGYKSK